MVVRRGMLAPAGRMLPACSRHIGVKMGNAMVRPIKFINAVNAIMARSRLPVFGAVMHYTFCVLNSEVNAAENISASFLPVFFQLCY